MTDQISIGLLIGSTEPPAWFINAVDELTTEIDCQLNTIIVPDQSDENDPNRSITDYVQYAWENRCWAPMELLKNIGRSRRDSIPELDPTPVTSLSGVSPNLLSHCNLEKVSEYRVALPPDIVKKMSKIDLALHAGVGILSGDILEAPKHGVWGVHHGNIRQYRGGPPGFWEFINREPEAIVTLQRYTERLDGGEVVLEKGVDISTAGSWSDVRTSMCRETISIFSQGVEKVIIGGKSTYRIDDLGPVYSRSDRDCIDLGKYIVATLLGNVRRV